LKSSFLPTKPPFRACLGQAAKQGLSLASSQERFLEPTTPSEEEFFKPRFPMPRRLYAECRRAD
jgi:hypothetical protein